MGEGDTNFGAATDFKIEPLIEVRYCCDSVRSSNGGEAGPMPRVGIRGVASPCPFLESSVEWPSTCVGDGAWAAEWTNEFAGAREVLTSRMAGSVCD